VRITSGKGRDCAILNARPNHKVKVTCNGAVAEIVGGE
jgi:hypothetical protein